MLQQTEVVLNRITDKCIVAAKSNTAKQRLVEVAIAIASETEKQKPAKGGSILLTIGLGIVFGLVFVWTAYEVIVFGLSY